MLKRFGAERVKKGLLHFGLGKLVSSGAGFLAMMLVVRGLSVEDFANYSVLAAVAELFSAVCGLGISHGLLRYVPDLYVRHNRPALRDVVIYGVLLRTAVLLLAVVICWLFADTASMVAGLEDVVAAFKIYLVVVVFRVTATVLSQVLESTLHQGRVQLAFSMAAMLRLLGMFILLNAGEVDLESVLWLEVACDFVSLLIMLLGVWQVLSEHSEAESGDPRWLWQNLREVARFCFSGYLQYLAALPYGGNTNRMVGSHMLTPSAMASFGFAQTLYEYVKRYLPAQLLVGLIRPIIVARYAASRDFGRAANLAGHIVQLNVYLQGVFFVLLGVAGAEVLVFVSSGKYGGESFWILLALMLVITLETNRLVLEILAQTVERYGFLIPSNLLLSLSVLPGVLLLPLMGAVSLPLCNAVALFVANFSVNRRLKQDGFMFRNDWRSLFETGGLIAIAVIGGRVLVAAQTGVWVAAGLSIGLYCLGGWLLKRQSIKQVYDDFLQGS